MPIWCQCKYILLQPNNSYVFILYCVWTFQFLHLIKCHVFTARRTVFIYIHFLYISIMFDITPFCVYRYIFFTFVLNYCFNLVHLKCIWHSRQDLHKNKNNTITLKILFKFWPCFSWFDSPQPLLLQMRTSAIKILSRTCPHYYWTCLLYNIKTWS